MPSQSPLHARQLVLILVVWMWGGEPSLKALPSTTALMQAQHTVWRLSDGAPSNVTDVAQATDGFLWMGSPQGLVRFDGRSFLAVSVEEETTNSWDVTALTALPGNELWVGTRRNGVAVLHDGKVVRRFGIAEGLSRSTVYSLRAGADGVMWAATSAGVYSLPGTQWKRTWPAEDQPSLPAANLLRDGSGQLCFTTDGGVFCKTADSTEFAQRFAGAIEDLAVSPDGHFWIWISGKGMLPLDAGDARKPTIPTYIPHGHMIFGQSGDLWVVTYGHGLNRFVPRGPSPEASNGWNREVFDRADGLQSGFLHSIYEDREGNLWLGSTKGLERFRSSKVTGVPALGESPSTVLLSNGSEMWAGVRYRALQRVGSDNRVTSMKKGPTDVTAAFRDRDGSAWFGSSPFLWHEQHNNFTKLQLPKIVQGSSDVQAMARDENGALWVSVVRFGVFRYTQGQWIRFEAPGASPTEYALAFLQDDAGRFWISYHNRLVLLEGGATRSFEQTQRGAADVQVLAGDGSIVWAAGQHGLAFYRAGEWRIVHTERDDLLTGVAGIVRTEDGALWMHCLAAVVRIAPEDVAFLKSGGDRRVPLKVFTFGDGLPGMAPQIRPLPSAALAADGKIWFSTTSGVGWIDPVNLPVNHVAPAVTIQTLQADGKPYPTSGSEALPPRVRTLAVTYTAPSLAMENGNQFRYRLIGFDNEWQKGGARQAAFFTALAPGSYRFEVEAVNEDGVASLTPAVLSFRIAPAFYQTVWFRMLAWTISALVLWGVYRLRLRFVTERIRNLLAERLSERERIARELHDTLLQGVQGLILLFQGIALQMPQDSPVAMKMEQALDRAERLMSEGRDSVRDLRASSVDIVSAMQALVHEQGKGEAKYSVEVSGQLRELQLLLSDELFKIGREAVINAFQHAEATWVHVTLIYNARSLELHVEDDGKGISQELAQKGRHGHWGLTGMRDRARKLQGVLEIDARKGGGTTVRLILPAKIAYRHSTLRAKAFFAKLGLKMGA